MCTMQFIFVAIKVGILYIGFDNVCPQLFEMGLELSLARLRALAKFAFGLGLSQVCT